ncbi:MAG: DNA polymerase III subunit delta [Oscillospiraceae bacterium]|nr:DNA polymerase III subunit delta [Oscillospiraceae bacterium]
MDETIDFDELLGNEQLKSRLSGVLRQDKASHCYLLSGPEGSGKRTLARLLCAALECTGGSRRPCRRCPHCHKVLQGIHPDVIEVDDESRKMLPVEQIRDVCADLYLLPNEGARKIYLFPHAEKLSPAGQNTLLKSLEEPPAYAVFLLLTPNPGLLLPTVRSRCTELHLSPLPERTLLDALQSRCPGRGAAEYRQAAAAGYLGQALVSLERPCHTPRTDAFAAAFADRNLLALLETLVPMEKWKREQLLPELQEWESLLVCALAARCGRPCPDQAACSIRNGRTAREILAATEKIRQAEDFCNANVAVGAVCGALAVNLS